MHQKKKPIENRAMRGKTVLVRKIGILGELLKELFLSMKTIVGNWSTARILYHWLYQRDIDGIKSSSIGPAIAQMSPEKSAEIRRTEDEKSVNGE